jgi:hypothetical protein
VTSSLQHATQLVVNVIPYHNKLHGTHVAFFGLYDTYYLPAIHFRHGTKGPPQLTVSTLLQITIHPSDVGAQVVQQPLDLCYRKTIGCCQFATRMAGEK